jgi:plasmid stabilization system protein ParE
MQLIWSPRALRDLARLHAFLTPKNPDAARRAIATIRQGVRRLGAYPKMGRPVDDLPPEFREWIIAFGNSAYIVRSRYDGRQLVILAIRHAREAGF